MRQGEALVHALAIERWFHPWKSVKIRVQFIHALRISMILIIQIAIPT
jgi:hypothetical protein